jgi:single-strand DNA-binding protein
VASNRFFKHEEEMQKEVSYFDVSTWARLAEVCGEYLKKGRGVRIVGRLKQDRWTDPDGKQHSRIEIVAEHVEFKPLLKKQDGDAAAGAADRKEEKAEGEETGAEERMEEEVEKAVSF